ncbi:carbamoyltransferase C-terminal domain-containing protein [Streptomyces carpaticus]|uniref:Carbamoyltransferase C-terminal domain-containing protein n=1 Tax=Streptomyces carpaticus TaxID=285558 RepID=A0ABV4ZHK1_9ACTN
MPTIGLHLGHDAGVALTQASGVHVIEAERRLGFRHVCAGNAGFPAAVAGWLAELRDRADEPVTQLAVADYYTRACRVLPPGLVELVEGDVAWTGAGGDAADRVLRRVKSEDWPLARELGEVTVTVVRHHYAHAALAYYTSGASRALVLALDGTGNYTECGMVALGEGSTLTPVLSFTNRNGPRFGLLYEALARRVHGGQFDTGKLLGLAAVGRVRHELLPVLRAMLVPDRVRRAEPDLYDPIDPADLAGTALRYADTWWELDPAAGGYLDGGLADSADDDVVHSLGSIFPDAIRTADGAVLIVGSGHEDPSCQDLAATLQAAVESDLVRLVTGLSRRFPGHDTLCYAGGCALNITANTALAESGLFRRVLVPTACDDSGVALGAALAAAPPADRPRLTGHRGWASAGYAGPALDTGPLGPRHTAELADRRTREIPDPEEFTEAVAALLAAGRCVAWLEGGMETGPRALGHRSLLISPHRPGARRHVSQTIKGREWFRPVAPLCPREEAARYFSGPLDHADAMLFAVRVRTEHSERLAEVRHLDGTARLQTVDAVLQPRLHRLCYALGAHTGLPILINTSANAGGRPILNSLGAALELLSDTELDAVALPSDGLLVY